jgi:hypothetical protein
MKEIKLQVEAKSNEEQSRVDTTQNPLVVIREAAKKLGSRPKEKFHGRRRVRRTWTGVVQGRRTWVGQPVILRNGETGWIKKVELGIANVKTCHQNEDGSHLHRYELAADLKILKCPEAVLLGSLKKGIKERKSERKGEASRKNGAMPVRPGNRKRGRPPKGTHGYIQPFPDELERALATGSVDDLMNFMIRFQARHGRRTIREMGLEI